MPVPRYSLTEVPTLWGAGVANTRVAIRIVGVVVFVGAAIGRLPEASADCHTSIAFSGSDTFVFGGLFQHESILGWTADYTSMRDEPELDIKVIAGDLASGRSADTWLDWATYSGHYDARVIRNYYEDSTYGSTAWYEDDAKGYMAGIQKEAGCTWDSTPQQFVNNCAPLPGDQGMYETPGCPVNNDPGSVVPKLNNYSTRDWDRHADGTDHRSTGGDPFNDSA
jgi:hypothetical protein